MPRPGSAVPAGSLEFMPTRRDRVSAEILRQLKSAILAGRLKSGDKLPSEKQLAQQFQSSRGSVREAIRTLEQAGLLVVRRGAGGGAIVADGDLRHVTDSLFTLIRLGSVSIHDLTEVRVILEPRIASLAAQRITAEELARIEAYVAKHAEAIAAGHLHATADLGFHRMLGRCEEPAPGALRPLDGGLDGAGSRGPARDGRDDQSEQSGLPSEDLRGPCPPRSRRGVARDARTRHRSSGPSGAALAGDKTGA